ncbi:100K [Psittacine adenovirus 3]|uniref:100K n=1 Tax=Psittacine adenovirus 3 TaxID=1580497 RepID=A0A0A7JTS9_9ADEN|nr:100K [Psittacine adenovirus 3]AIZ35776.1 100K [Psittacine adenovirus 3]
MEESGAGTGRVPDDTLTKHLARQAKIMKTILGEELDADDVTQLGEKLAAALFTPKERKADGDPDPRLNYFPPFLTPECLALHFPFFLNLPIPMSCKANRSGTQTLSSFWETSTLPCELPDPGECNWNDSLGNVLPIAELKSNQKLALLEEDSSRLSWFKAKASEQSTFAFPCTALPAPLQKLLIEVLVGKPQEPNSVEEYEAAVSDVLISQVCGDEDPERVRKRLLNAVTTSTCLECMKRLFMRPDVIKNVQESLHYTFHHGFVKLIHLLTNCNLSEFVTYHGLTHRNRLNNCELHNQLLDLDRADYMCDCIYLFLLLTWQTAMDIWQQTLDEKTLKGVRRALTGELPNILLCTSASAAGTKIADLVFPDVMVEALCANLPDFINQAQLSNFRTFICMKSGVPQSMCPMLPSDMVPLAFEEAHPVLWPHVLLMRLSAFLLNHGCYRQRVERPQISTCLCECNLCSPHRMPCYNPRLLEEILTINKFEFQSPPDDQGKTKVIKLSPQTFANAYLQKFNSADYFFDRVTLYINEKARFRGELTAAVIKNEKLLALLRETQVRREIELVKRGGGVYLDPDTGEPLSVQVPDRQDGEISPPEALQAPETASANGEGEERSVPGHDGKAVPLRRGMSKQRRERRVRRAGTGRWDQGQPTV